MRKESPLSSENTQRILAAQMQNDAVYIIRLHLGRVLTTTRADTHRTGYVPEPFPIAGTLSAPPTSAAASQCQKLLNVCSFRQIASEARMTFLRVMCICTGHRVMCTCYCIGKVSSMTLVLDHDSEARLNPQDR